jgi:hypothetical protein
MAVKQVMMASCHNSYASCDQTEAPVVEQVQARAQAQAAPGMPIHTHTVTCRDGDDLS